MSLTARFGVKPSLWAWSQARVHPRMKSALRGCTHLIPFWEGAGMPRNLIPDRAAFVESGVNAWGFSYGSRSLTFNSTAGYLSLGENPAASQGGFTAMFIGMRTDAGLLDVMFEAGTSADRTFLMRIGSSSVLDVFAYTTSLEGGSTGHTIPGAGIQFAATGVFDGVNIWGVLDQSAKGIADTAATATMGASSVPLTVSTAFGKEWENDAMLAAIWQRALAVDEIHMIHQDPFALIRRVYRQQGVPPPPVTNTVAARLSSQLRRAA